MTMVKANKWLQEIVDALGCVPTKGSNKSPISKLLANEPRTR